MNVDIHLEVLDAALATSVHRARLGYEHGLAVVGFEHPEAHLSQVIRHPDHLERRTHCFIHAGTVDIVKEQACGVVVGAAFRTLKESLAMREMRL